VDAGDAIADAQRIADEVLFPAAQRVDRADRIPATHLTALAEAGLYGAAGPPEHGGLGLTFPEVRRAMAAVASGCGATFFTWAQHLTLTLQLAATENHGLQEEMLADLCAGGTMAGIVFAHLRRPDRPVAATRVGGGWRLAGTAPWATAWGIADCFSLVAESDSGDAVWMVVDGDDRPGVSARLLELPVLMATRTVTIGFDGVFVPDERVVNIESADGWRAADRVRSSIGGSQIYGLIDRTVGLLAESAHGSGDPATEVAARMREELAEEWRHDDELLGAMMAGTDIVRVGSEHRAAGLELARRATSALLAAVGGRGMALDHPAQRLAREADFYVIQAQTTDGRAALLRNS
jgi:alkylation response protein AidB-like acyl-CoA dehydrogenase